MSQVTVGSYVRTLVDIRAQETDGVIASAGSVGIVDEIKMGFGGPCVDVMIDDVHFLLHIRGVEAISEEEFRAAYANR